jgi:cAMP phosphodiesterase
VYGSEEVLGILRTHLFNGLIWPDFSAIPDRISPVIHWESLEPCQKRSICGYQIIPVPVNHSVPAFGYIISSDSSRLLFTGDTGPTNLIWELAGDLSLLIVEVSFPNSQEELALRTGHLTPRLLEQELYKLPYCPQRIRIMHLKSVYRKQIISEIDKLNIKQIEVLEDETCINL